MYYEIHASDISAHAQSPAIIYMLDRYEAMVDGSPPDAARMPISDFAEHAPFLMLLEPQDGGGHRYVHYGQGIVRAAGFDLTGHPTSYFDGPLGAFFHKVYERCRTEGRPLFTIHRAVKARTVHTWERLVLPLAFPCGQIGFLVYNRPRLFQQDFLGAMLDILPEAVMAVRAVRDDEGVVEDAVVVTANAVARSLFAIAEGEVDVAPMKDKLIACGASTVWEACLDAIERRTRTAKDIVCLCCAEARHMNLDVAPLLDGAVLRLSDITVMTNINIALEFERSRLQSELACERSEAGRLRLESVIDPLTGLLNRRGFAAHAAGLWDSGGPLTVVATDIDHFKKVNDLYGHATGDKVLRHVARRLSLRVLDQQGVAARWGGEEFLALLPASIGQARLSMEMLRTELGLRHVSSPLGPVCVTSSFGIADARAFPTLDAAIDAADAALYRAKEEGRNRTCLAPTPDEDASEERLAG